MREVVFAEVAGQRLVGTFHRPREVRPSLGLLFLNAGYVPRDGHGGLSALACDRLAEQGIPAFRFDLPRLGDSPGEVPARAQDLFDEIYGGGYTEATVALEQQVRSRYGLKGMLVGGLCGAAITAVYAADRDPTGIRGVLLLEPEFFVPEPVAQETPGTKDDAPPSPLALGRLRDRGRALLARVAEKATSYWGWMRLLTLENRYSRYLKYLPLPREAILRWVLEKEKLPAVTNLPLVGAWRRVMERKTPALAITASGKLHDLFFQQINRVALAGLPDVNVTCVRLTGTNHIFTTGGAIPAAIQHLVEWVERVRA